MSRRVSLPTADDLFRRTPQPRTPEPRDGRNPGPAAHEMAARSEQAESPEPSKKKPSGRVRHDEKMTVYVTADELLDIEHARLSLRRDQGLAVDRGRMVREAIAIVLADLETNGDDSDLVQRLIAR